MGAYINTPETKEIWLRQHGKPTDNPTWPDNPKEELPVCLVDNGPFTAAGICFSPSEFECFRTPDHRAKIWYLCKVQDLLTVSNLKDYLR